MEERKEEDIKAEVNAKRRDDYQKLKDTPGFLENRRIRQKEYYQKVKDKPEYKVKRAAYFKKWLGNPDNRKRFNDLLRERNRIYALARRQKFKEQGVCLHCGKKRDNETKLCAPCQTMFKKAHKRHNEKLKLQLNKDENERRLTINENDGKQQQNAGTI